MTGQAVVVRLSEHSALPARPPITVTFGRMRYEDVGRAVPQVRNSGAGTVIYRTVGRRADSATVRVRRCGIARTRRRVPGSVRYR